MPTFPALQLRSPDIGAALGRAEQIKGARSQNALMAQRLQAGQRAAASAEEIAAARRDLFTPPQPDPVALQPDPLTPDVPALNFEEATKVTSSSPAARKYLAAGGKVEILVALASMDAAGRKQVAQMNEMRGRAAEYILSLPEDQRAAAYLETIADLQARGVKTDMMSPEYNEVEVKRQLAMARPLKDVMAEKRPKGRPVAVADPKAPGKSVYVSPQQALGERPPPPKPRPGMTDTALRVKGMAWVSAQKDDLGKPKYVTPEQQRAALKAYELAVKGDDAGAQAALKALDPKKAADEPNWFDRQWRSLKRAVLGAGEPTGPTAGSVTVVKPPPKAGKTIAGAGTTADPYRVTEKTTQAEVDALPTGAWVINPATGQPVRKK